ncbi:MAG TPA: hypothetical protein PK460_04630 [Bacilli bacterium]|nr:hypothetical protein [Bacilli bacterium]HOQ71060.1 hypothetical protein [Bacilli bacterium]HPK29010.1 hypothetical protein [Bacilli bacterium]
MANNTYNYDNIVPEWNYSEFKHLKRVSNPRTAFARGYLFEEGEFYIEPWFYTQLTRILERFRNEHDEIMDVFFNIARKEKYVLFTRDINEPIFDDENYLLVEIEDIIEGAKLIIDDNSRGSDYGD